MTSLKPVKWGVPLFIFANNLIAFLRNDSAPTLATVATFHPQTSINVGVGEMWG